MMHFASFLCIAKRVAGHGVNSNGYYEMTFYLKTAVGGLSHFVTVSTHHYDLMNVNIKASSNDKATAKSNFYYLKYCD